MKRKMKRLGVFVFYDRDSIVDDYVLYLLDDMCKNLDDLIVLSNSPLENSEKNKFLSYTDKIIIRENKGLDAGAWCEFFRDNSDYFSYDEVVCFNDTFFGPLYPFKEMFDVMAEKNVDFWGMCQGHTHCDGYGVTKDGVIPNHIQTFLMTFRNNVLCSDVFQNYWKDYDLEKMLTFRDVVSKHELFFTKYLEDRGFKWDCYVKDMDGTENHKRNYVNFAYNSYGQISECRAPFVKRKTVVSDLENVLYLTDLGDIRKTMEFIKEHTDYPVSLIYKNVLRLYPLNLLSRGTGFYDIVHEICHQDRTEVAVIVKMENEQFVSKFKDVFKNMDETKKVVVYTKNKKIYETLKKEVDVNLYEENWKKVFEDLAKNLNTLYVQFVHIKERKDVISLVDSSCVIKVLENLFVSSEYYESVLDLLKQDETSVVYAPENIHFDYFYGNLLLTDRDLSILKLLFPNYKCFSANDNFVIKSDAWLTKKEVLSSIDFAKIDDMGDEAFCDLLATALAYAGVNFNGIPKIVMSEEMALIRLNSLSSIYKDTYQAIYQNNDYGLTYLECINKIRTQREERRVMRVLKDAVKRKLHIKRFKFWKK